MTASVCDSFLIHIARKRQELRALRGVFGRKRETADVAVQQLLQRSRVRSARRRLEFVRLFDYACATHATLQNVVGRSIDQVCVVVIECVVARISNNVVQNVDVAS